MRITLPLIFLLFLPSALNAGFPRSESMTALRFNDDNIPNPPEFSPEERADKIRENGLNISELPPHLISAHTAYWGDDAFLQKVSILPLVMEYGELLKTEKDHAEYQKLIDLKDGYHAYIIFLKNFIEDSRLSRFKCDISFLYQLHLSTEDTVYEASKTHTEIGKNALIEKIQEDLEKAEIFSRHRKLFVYGRFFRHYFKCLGSGSSSMKDYYVKQCLDILETEIICNLNRLKKEILKNKYPGQGS